MPDDPNKPNESVAVVGLGKIGLPLAAQFASAGFHVTGCDISEYVVSEVNAGRSHVKEEPGLAEMVEAAVALGKLRATTDTTSAVAHSSIVVVIVPLIVDGAHNVDYRAVDAATEAVGRGLQPGTLVIYETTLPVGTTRTRFGPALEKLSGLSADIDFLLAFSPERVYSGRIFHDLLTYPKIVGGTTPEATERAHRFYSQALAGAEVLQAQDADSAELVKLLETTYRDVNIALANEFAQFAAKRNLPVDQAITMANTQPYSHIHRPGIGVGGHCIPVYPYFLINAADEGEMAIPSLSRRVNDDMAGWALARLEEALGGLEGKRIAMFGLSYRENVKETAFSTGVRLVSALKAAGASVFVNDPLFTDEEIAAYGAEPFALDTPPACDAALMQACHDAYRDLDWAKLAEAGCRAVLDGRNRLSPKAIGSAGMIYLGIGR